MWISTCCIRTSMVICNNYTVTFFGVPQPSYLIATPFPLFTSAHQDCKPDTTHNTNW